MEDNLKFFLAENAIAADTIKYAPSKRFVNQSGEAIEWEIQPLTVQQDTELRDSCKKKEFIPGSRNTSVTIDSDRYTAEMIAACVKYPNLNSAELQRSYGVVGAVALVQKMLTPGEYTDLAKAVSQANGYNEGMEEKIRRAKN